jgi:hypothetical protein
METQLIHTMKVAGLTLTTLHTVAPHTMMPISLLTTCAALAVAVLQVDHPTQELTLLPIQQLALMMQQRAKHALINGLLTSNSLLNSASSTARLSHSQPTDLPHMPTFSTTEDAATKKLISGSRRQHQNGTTC